MSARDHSFYFDRADVEVVFNDVITVTPSKKLCECSNGISFHNVLYLWQPPTMEITISPTLLVCVCMCTRVRLST